MDRSTDKAAMIRRGWFAVSLGAAFYCYQFIVRVFPNILHQELMDIFSIDTDGLGLIISTYGWAYSLMQLPLGLAIDRWGPRYLVSIASLFVSLGCVLFIATKSVYVAAFGRFLMGMGSACGFMSCVKLATLWLPPRQLSRAIAVTMICGTFGAALGGTPLSLIERHVGPYYCILGLAGLGLLMSLVLITLIPQRSPVKRKGTPTKAALSEANPLQDLYMILRNPQSWIIAFYSMLMYVPITVWGEAWGVPFVERATNSSEYMAAIATTCMFAGAAIGSPLFTALSDQWRSRRSPIVLGSILALATNAMIVLTPDIPLMLMYVLFFFTGLVYTAKVLTFSCICEIMPRSMSGISVAMINSIVMLTGAVYHPLIGFLAKGHAEQLGPIPVNYMYSYYDYQFALTVVPASILLAVLFGLFIKDTHPDRNRFSA